uniref:DNA-directed RNA polymerase subunit beta n=1 Tax=Binuclearia lauterbornii TaxID=3087189 RepID=A0A097KPB5_9CHLO|nr:beta subunit of RNA polymerase [Binuclearia lauterbornii]AIT95043.1 beta subunit of RNA polymerase [Binuclearia lauterbornii]
MRINDFIEIQRESFSNFLEKGFIKELSLRNPISNPTKDLELIFYPDYYQLNPPEWLAKESILQAKTYACRLYVPAQLFNKKTKQVTIQWVLLGNLPLMTKRGHFIINGSPRIIVNQMIRSPGIYYQEVINKNKKKTYYADLISYRGAWLRFELDKKKLIWVRMKKTPKISILVFLQSIGFSKEKIFQSIQYSDYLKNSFLKDNHPNKLENSLITLYSETYPKKEKSLLTSEFGQKLLFRKFMNPRTYDLGTLGRIKLNKKLGLSIPLDKKTLTSQDLLNAIDYLIKLDYGIGELDDIDNLKNRRIRASGEIIQNQISIGLIRLEKLIREKLKKPRKTITIRNLITTKPINGALREFFGSSQLSQFMDQTNPLAEITHKRRLSSLGPGGVSRETAGMAVRGIHPTHYGRICPIETPEGQNAGLVNSITSYAKLNKNGFIETPLYKVYKGQVQKELPILLFSAEQEEEVFVAPSDLKISKLLFLPKKIIPTRFGKDFKRVKREQIDFVAISPIQMISIATSLIPFLEHDDANRALMGSNMQRQAVPLMSAERPIVGTGLEIRVSSDSGHSLQSKVSGYISQVSGEKITILYLTNSTEQELGSKNLKKKKGNSKMELNLSLTKIKNLSSYKIILKNSTVNFSSQKFLTKITHKKNYFKKSLKNFTSIRPFQESIKNLLFQKEEIQNYLLIKKSNILSSSTHEVRAELRSSSSKMNNHKQVRSTNTSFNVVKQSITKPIIKNKNLQTPLSFEIKNYKLAKLEYILQNYQRSNQETCITNRPLVKEGDWVQKGDLLADGSASVGGELALGKNILIAYMPWEGYNFEDAILINERLVLEDVYTSVHIERYEIEIRDTKYGIEQITNQIPEIEPSEILHLDINGIAKIGSWVKEGDILIGKVTPINKKPLSPHEKLLYDIVGKEIPTTRDSSLRVPKGVKGRIIDLQILETQNLPPETFFDGPGRVHIYIAEKRRIQVGDKVAGRHGNKGIVSKILPRQDMPYLPDGTPVDMVLNPLGVPSRMNVGQVFECLLGLAGISLNQQYKILPFDETFGPEASRSTVYSELYKSRLKTKQDWLFNPNAPGKIRLLDGRLGKCFDQQITVGQAYILKLVHLVDEKIHARSTGPYSLVTQQPLRGRSKHGGQRLGEMEVWALEGFGAAYILQELLTIKSDDMKGRHQVMDSILKNKPISLGTPESFKVLIRELQSLCLDVRVYGIDSAGKRKQIDVMKLN